MTGNDVSLRASGGSSRYVINLIPMSRMLKDTFLMHLASQNHISSEIYRLGAINIDNFNNVEWFTLLAEAIYEPVSHDQYRPKLIWMLEMAGIHRDSASYITGEMIEHLAMQIACIDSRYNALSPKEGRFIDVSIAHPLILCLGVTEW